MKILEATIVAIKAIKGCDYPMPDEDVKAALRILRTVQRAEINKS